MSRDNAIHRLMRHAWQVGPCGRRVAGIGVLFSLMACVFQIWATVRDWHTMTISHAQSATTVKALAILSIIWLFCNVLLCVWIQAQAFVGWEETKPACHRQPPTWVSTPQALTTWLCLLSGLGVTASALAFFVISWQSGVYLPRCPMEYFPFVCEILFMLIGAILVLALVGLAFYGLGYCMWRDILVHLCTTDIFILWCPCVQRAWQRAVASAVVISHSSETGVIVPASAPPYQSIC